jgi:WD40 repeat protein
VSDDLGGTETILSRGGGHPASTALVPDGAVIAGYAIEALAGYGGMGVVYRARDTALGRTVALKLIAPERAGDARLRELFVRESLTAAALEHPNVIPIYRAGDDRGRLFIAMRFVEGASLQDLITASPAGIPPGRAARITARVAHALDAAHARGLVHRDVKPANVLIADPEGEEHVYLSDFGLSVYGAGAAGGGGGWVGTLAYLAPEQIRGEALDARTDVYALGCVLFHALTGRTPFSTDDEPAALTSHLEARPPAPSSLVPGLPPALDDVVRRAMAKRPEDRFASAGELGRAALAARYDVALLLPAEEQAAGDVLAARLRESEVLPLVTVAGEARAAEGIRASGACAVLVGRSGLGDWARDGLAAARAVSAHDRAFRLVLVLLPGAPDPSDPTLAYLAPQPWVDLRAGAADALAAADLIRALRGADVPAGLAPAPGEVSPYRGLEAFREEDADLFFGREQDVARLIERLRSARFMAVIGASGSGKSSVVHAGMLPALRRDAVPGSAGWRVLELVPGARPLSSLATQLAHLPGAGAPSGPDLAADERALDLAVARALEGRPPGDRVIVVVDQLEEVFTLCPDEGERAAFLGNLVYASTIPGGRAVVVVTMRADFYQRLAEIPEARALVADRQVLLGPLDARGLRRAIEEPARRCGLELEPGLTRRILTDVADRPGTLPLLEHLLFELWRRRRRRTLTLEAYAESGGVEGALARRANDVYGAMAPERQAIVRRVLLRLTQPGEGTEDTRRRVERRELVTDPAERTEVDVVVNALAEARLVSTSTDETTGEPIVEVTHEALIRGWPELRGWLDEDRDRLRAARRLSDAALEWDRGGRDEGALYRGARLSAWQERGTADLTPLEREFLNASVARAERDRQARRRRLRIGVGVLALVTAVIAILGVVALVQRNDAADQRDLAVSRQLAANARLQLAADPELGVLLADEALTDGDTIDAGAALRQTTYQSAIRFALRDHEGRVSDAAFTPDGRTVVTGGQDGTLRIWVPGEDQATRIDTGQGAVASVEVSPDGGTVASAGQDGTVRLWSTSGQPGRVLRGHDGAVNALAFAPSSKQLVSGGSDGTVRIWRLADGTARVIPVGEAPINGVAVSPDGRRVASGGADTLVKLWGIDGRPLRTLEGHTDQVQDVAFSPDGRLLASAAGDFTARLWPIEGDEPPTVLRASQIGAVQRIEFDERGTHVVTAGDDGTARAWTPAGQLLATLGGHEGPVLSARFSPDGRSVLSAGEDGSARVWWWRQGLPLTEVASSGDFPSDGGAIFAPGGRRVLSAGIDGSLSAWDLQTQRLTPVLPALTTDSYASVAAFSPDARLFAVAIVDADVVVRNTNGEGRPLALRGHDGPVWAMDFSDDGRSLLTAGADGTLRLWNLSTRTATVVETHQGLVSAADLSADGSTAVSGGEDETVRIWDIASSLRPRAVLRGHEGPVLDVEISADGRRVVSSSIDRSVRLWDLSAGTSKALRGHQARTFAAFGAGDSRIISTSGDGIRLWDGTTGAPVLEIASPDRDAYRAVLSPDGTRIALQTTDARIQLLSCETCGSLERVRALARTRVTRAFTPAERDAFDIGSES